MAGPEAPGDWGVFFDAADGFAGVVIYTPQGGMAQEIEALWTDAHVERAVAGGVVSGTSPVVTLALAALASPPRQGDTIEIRAATWTVADVQPGGTGVVRLILEG